MNTGKNLEKDKAEDNGPQHQAITRLYKKRWFLLALISALNFFNAATWISFAPIANLANAFYCDTSAKNCDAANWLSMAFMICTTPTGFLAIWCLDKYGLRLGILSGAWLNVIGGAFRLISSSTSFAAQTRFILAITGQIIAAFGQPFIIYMPPKLASRWFPDYQRALANVIGSIANAFGTMTSTFVAPFIVNDYANLANQIFYLIFRSKPFLILLLMAGSGIGWFNTFCTLLGQILCAKGYDNKFAGICGACAIGSGLIFSLLGGVFTDKTRKFEETLKTGYCLASVAISIISVLTLTPNLHIPIAVACSFYGLFLISVYPIALELGVECTHPVAEATSTGLIIMTGQAFGFIFTGIMAKLSAIKTGNSHFTEQPCSNFGADNLPRNWKIPNLVFATINALTVVFFVIFFHPKYKRMNAERGGLMMKKDGTHLVTYNPENSNQESTTVTRL